MSDRAQVTRTVTFIPEMGNYLSYLLVSTGDLYQRYKGMYQNPEVFPNFANNPVTVDFVLQSSNGSDVNFDAVEWFVGNTKIVFGTDGVSTNSPYIGIFQRSTVNGRARLTIKGNLVTALNGVSSTLKGVVTKETDAGAESTFMATVPVTITKVTDGDYRINMRAVNPDKQHIAEKNETIQYTAVATHGIDQINVGDTTEDGTVAFRFSVYQSPVSPNTQGTWVEVSQTPANSGVIAISEGDVQSSALYRVELLVGGNSRAVDQHTVYDESDDYIIFPNPTPEDRLIYEGNPDRQSVTFKPQIGTDKEGVMPTVAPNTGHYSFELLDEVGNSMRSGQTTTVSGVEQFVVDIADVTHCPNVTVVIYCDI